MDEAMALLVNKSDKKKPPHKWSLERMKAISERRERRQLCSSRSFAKDETGAHIGSDPIRTSRDAKQNALKERRYFKSAKYFVSLHMMRDAELSAGKREIIPPKRTDIRIGECWTLQSATCQIADVVTVEERK